MSLPKDYAERVSVGGLGKIIDAYLKVGVTNASRVNGQLLIDVEYKQRSVLGGGVAYVVEQGRLTSQAMLLKPNRK